MKCPFCGSGRSHVTDTTHAANENAIKRRRQCLDCKGRYSTLETITRRSIIESNRNRSFNKVKVGAAQIEQTVFITENERQRDMSRNRPFNQAQDRFELEATYQAALKLVARIDFDLERGIHYRTSSGRLLTTLDEVVRAILADELPPLENEPAALPLEQPGELILARAA